MRSVINDIETAHAEEGRGLPKGLKKEFVKQADRFERCVSI